METRGETVDRSPFATLLSAAVVIGLVRATARFSGFLALLAIVIGCVLVLTVGILILKLLVLH